MADKTYEIGEPAFDDLVMEHLSHKTISVAALNSWGQALHDSCRQFHRVTVDEAGDMVFEAIAGSDAGNVARGLFNMSLHFKVDTSCRFNGMEISVKHVGD